MKILLSTISSEQKTFTESLYMLKWKNGESRLLGVVNKQLAPSWLLQRRGQE